jgi:hypothetical protein
VEGAPTAPRQDPGEIDTFDAPPESPIEVNRLRAAIRRDDPRPGTSILATCSDIAVVADEHRQ